MQTTETELSKSLDEFYCRFKLTRINHQGDMLTYKIGKSKFAGAFAMDEANRIISSLQLPLKAEVHELIQSSHNILKISAV